MRPRAPARLLSQDRVEFRFDARLWGCGAPSFVTLGGSFTEWRPELTLRRSWRGWRLIVPRSRIDVPGNSGEPEFRFTADGTLLACPDIEGWPRVGENAVVPLRTVPQPRREANHRTAQRFKTRLDEYPDSAALANFRAVVPGTLYRSYHPFLASRATPVEVPRLRAATRLLEAESIGAVINLTDHLGVLAHPDLPPPYEALAHRGAVLFAETSYEDAYYHPEGAEFGAVVGRVLAFVAERRGPYLVHCRLGMDRTGVVTALLAGLAGLSWSALVEDYLRSNELGIREYRDEALLAHSFTRMLGTDPRQVVDLSTALVAFCLRHGVPASVVEGAQSHLRATPRSPS